MCLVDNRRHDPASGTADEATDGRTAASDTTASTTAGKPRETEAGTAGNYRGHCRVCLLLSGT